ncbi:MAG: hypothetical protein ABI995_08535 [Acidobacteriota bacterium]
MTRVLFASTLFTAVVLGQASSQAPSHDLRGIWQAQGSAYRDLEAEKGVVSDPTEGKIPYRADARATVERNKRERATTDPLFACFQPGVPRATLLPEPLQIFQNDDRIVIVYQHVHAYRVIFTDGRPHYDDGIEFYMGDSRGKWEGNTFVADVTNFKPETWLDGAGHFHGNKLHVIERFTRTGPNTIGYQATIEDPEVFERPWTIRLTLERHTEKNFQLVEHECERDAKGGYRHPQEFLKIFAP